MLVLDFSAWLDNNNNIIIIIIITIIIIIQYLYSALKSCKGYRGDGNADMDCFVRRDAQLFRYNSEI